MPENSFPGIYILGDLPPQYWRVFGLESGLTVGLQLDRRTCLAYEKYDDKSERLLKVPSVHGAPVMLFAGVEDNPAIVRDFVSAKPEALEDLVRQYGKTPEVGHRLVIGFTREHIQKTGVPAFITSPIAKKIYPD